MTDQSDPRNQLLDAALAHVPFDGWSDPTFRDAIADTGMTAALARGVCPRGALDLAVAYHQRGDAVMSARLAEMDLPSLRIRDRITTAVRARIEAIDDKEAVRRGATLFALPQHAPEGARLIWNTCDLIWNAVGDTSTDGNWYSKRAILSGVYSGTVLFWLGDDSAGNTATWDFLDRRIENVMQFEKFKAQANDNPLLKPLLAGPNWLLSRMKAPTRRDDLPGSLRRDG